MQGRQAETPAAVYGGKPLRDWTVGEVAFFCSEAGSAERSGASTTRAGKVDKLKKSSCQAQQSSKPLPGISLLV